MPAVTPIPWKVLTDVYKKLPGEEDFFLTKALLNDRRNLPTDTVTFRILKYPASVASLSLPGDPPRPVSVKLEAEEVSHKTLQIFEEDRIDANQAAYDWRLDALNQGILNSAGDIVDSLRALYEPKLKELKNRVSRRIELMAAQVLTAGEISYTDDYRTITVNYGVTSAQSMSFGDTALDVIKTAVRDFADNYGGYPDMIIMSADVADAFLANAQVEKFINRNTFGWGNLSPKRTGNVIYLGNFPEFEIPDIYVYNGWYHDGTQKQKYIPDGTLVMTSKEIWHLVFGSIVDFEIDPSGRPIITDLIVKENIVDRGTAKSISVLTKPLVYIHNAAGIAIYAVS